MAAAADGLPAIVAWLRWHLGGETERKAAFLDPTGAFKSADGRVVRSAHRVLVAGSDSARI